MWRSLGKLHSRRPAPGTAAARAAFSSYSRSLASTSTKTTTTIPKPKRTIDKYDPSIVESGWYEWWESQGFFSSKVAAGSGSTSGNGTGSSDSPARFTMLLPPPNVTGYLHIGHALTASIQDSIVRWRRMRGESVSWVPGMDHAGISTQTVVEKKLMRERKLTRHDLGREDFIKEIWDWKELHGDRITRQFRRLGASMDWEESFFTLDETRTKAVKASFIKLFEDGLVYRDTRLVNWCCALETVISDIEVDHEDIEGRTMLNVPGRLKKVEFGVLHDFAYKVEGDETQELVVSTTRIETMLGDVAVAIHPEDPRYTHLHGRHVIHPITGKRLPIICDPELVEMEFGTGVVKVTPAHDPNDYACGRRHGLPIINILDKDGTFNANCGSKKYEKMNRFDARDEIIRDLMDLGVYRDKNEKHAMRLARCSRSGDVIEPLVMPQWYIKCDGMAQQALKDAENQNLVFHPESSIKDWNRWLENIQDWCISRQLWWGHRIPAYRPVFEQHSILQKHFPTDTGDGPWFVADSESEATQQIQKFLADKGLQDTPYKIVQDDDVLDTWFSSGLLPLSSLGWTGGKTIPGRYPTNLIETGTDIMFFWVARMVMLCTHLSGEVPFKDILFHAMVRDAQGRKMSKSIGNVIDPTHVIEGITLKDLKATLEGGNLAAKEVKRSQTQMEKDFPKGIQASGADALRFALVSSTQQSRQINLDLQNVTSAQHFANKLWNLSAFYRTRLGDLNYSSSVTSETVLAQGLAEFRTKSMAVTRAGQGQHQLSLVERFIMSRLADTVSKVNGGMEQLEPSIATDTVRKFIIQDLCDVYVEFIKPVLVSEDQKSIQQRDSVLKILQTCFDASLRMMHPFMPFVTEELWQRMLPESVAGSTSIMVSSFPSSLELESWRDEVAEKDMEVTLGVIQASRSLRQSHQVPMSKDLPFTVWTSDASLVSPGGALLESQSSLTHFTRSTGEILLSQTSSATSNNIVDPLVMAVHIISPELKLLTPLSAIKDAIAEAEAIKAAAAAAANAANVGEANKKQEQELKRLSKKLGNVQAELEKLGVRLGRPEYSERVPEKVQQLDTKRRVDLLAQEEHLLTTIKTLDNGF
ncbi:MAG: tRNA synthetases class I-domain-containing protein [Linnemannia gamsii]|nr:MAG: tRNA synthetases class I-domain-containing protein [Linnemannia gamsii]